MKAWYLVIAIAAFGCAGSTEPRSFTCAHTCLVPTISTDPVRRFPPGTVTAFGERRWAMEKAQAERDLVREVLAQSTRGVACCAICEEP